MLPCHTFFQTLNHETILMTNKDGKRFQCNIPMSINTNKDQPQQNITNTSLVVEGLSSHKTLEDLLDALKDKCFRRVSPFFNNIPI